MTRYFFFATFFAAFFAGAFLAAFLVAICLFSLSMVCIDSAKTNLAVDACIRFLLHQCQEKNDMQWKKGQQLFCASSRFVMRIWTMCSDSGKANADSALDSNHRKPGKAGLLAARLHVEAGRIQVANHLIERDFMRLLFVKPGARPAPPWRPWRCARCGESAPARRSGRMTTEGQLKN